MKKFKVTVNGKSYEVDVEELGTARQPRLRPKQHPRDLFPTRLSLLRRPCPEKFQLLSRKTVW